MESAAAFGAGVEEGYIFISFDIKAGYRFFFLRKDVSNFFAFTYSGRDFRCIDFTLWIVTFGVLVHYPFQAFCDESQGDEVLSPGVHR